VTKNKSSSIIWLLNTIWSWGSRQNTPSISVKSVHSLPKSVLVLNLSCSLVVILSPCCSTVQVLGSKAWDSSDSVSIATVELGPGLLNKVHPVRLISGSSKSWSTIAVNWDVVVDKNDFLVSIDVHLDTVDTSIIGISVQEKTLNISGLGGDASHGSDKVAVSDFTLLDLSWEWSSIEDASTWIDLAESSP